MNVCKKQVTVLFCVITLLEATNVVAAQASHLLLIINHVMVCTVGLFFTMFYRSFSFNTDINECVYMMNNCSQFCNNTVGSYLCACSYGYVLAADNSTCNSKLYIYWLDCLVF